MPRRPVRARSNDTHYNLVVRIPGWLKNDIVDHCEQLETPINSWIASLILEGLRTGKGLPPAPPAQHPIPTIEDVLRSYVVGERIMMPCGKPSPCEGTSSSTFGGITYCDQCGIRTK